MLERDQGKSNVEKDRYIKGGATRALTQISDVVARFRFKLSGAWISAAFPQNVFFFYFAFIFLVLMYLCFCFTGYYVHKFSSFVGMHDLLYNIRFFRIVLFDDSRTTI